MSRSLDDLLPEVKTKAEELIAAGKAKGLNLLPIQTLRTYAEQDTLYAQGRTAPGHIVTHARGGESWHNFARAFDIAPVMSDGKIWWNAPPGIWQEIGEMGEAIGLTWGGRWAQPKTDLDHFELTGGLTLAQARAQHEV